MKQSRDHASENRVAYENGATRSEKLERYDLIPPEADEALAERFGLGAGKHGETNWKSGGAAFIKACINHARAHEVNLLATAGECADDDLAAILCNYAMLAWFRKHKTSEYAQALRELRGT
ncbi:MAG TPA: dATP/dGTP diphosphohydrolase domain-containing protein [Terriglobales bacterium]|nr:dATP/dGTP diphosphohydrolase domain-containing protein [Terriglobales bacterium]